MAPALDPDQMLSFGELFMPQAVQQEALTRLLIEKGLFIKKKFMEPENGESGDECENEIGIRGKSVSLVSLDW